MQSFTSKPGAVWEKSDHFEQIFGGAAVPCGITTSLARRYGSVPLMYRPDSGILTANIPDLPFIGRF
jgi:hypothetical protein